MAVLQAALMHVKTTTDEKKDVEEKSGKKIYSAFSLSKCKNLSPSQ
jgi:hypothetical protein